MNFSRFVCWKTDRLRDVINVEALTFDRATFLATHSPFVAISQGYPDAEAVVGEDDIYRKLVAARDNDQHAFIVIVGTPGTGKSHLIRWLQDRYQSDRAPDELVLLIERATNSLRGTIEQIVESGLFDSEALAPQLDRLRDAGSALSKEAFGEHIVNCLHTVSVDLKAQNPRIDRGLRPFLLDESVRSFLRRDGGPIQRIERFLTKGRRVGSEDAVSIEFAKEDFEFEVADLRRVQRSGSEDARELAEALLQKEVLREELAGVLNTILGKAIGLAVSISSAELREIFLTLRRELRVQGKSLILLIEDITAATGIDEGLLDALVVQHRSEGDEDLCRMSSVVGITDSYFKHNLPTNILDRITSRYSLNAEAGRRTVSGLLQEQGALYDLCARYLNALRCSDDQLQDWANRGAAQALLPNPCSDCVFRDVCHSSFGSVRLGKDKSSPMVGLYPFNRRSLDAMYEGLAEKRSEQTPRTLLRDVLLYVLQMHGEKIQSGRFPPPSRELGSAFEPPSFEPGHDQILRKMAGTQAERLESLLTFWGDHSVYARAGSDERTVGGLPRAVFRAFDLEFIPGIEEGGDLEDITTDPKDVGTNTKPDAGSKEHSKFDDDIRRWRDGEKLHTYQPLRSQLVDFVKWSTQWELHGISTLELSERLKDARVFIDGQSGIQHNDMLIFHREVEFTYVLEALANMNDPEVELREVSTGRYVSNLTQWAEETEGYLLSYVGKPSTEVAAPDIQVVLLAAAVYIAVLFGQISPGEVTPRSLYRDLKAMMAGDEVDQQEAFNRIVESSVRCKKWIGTVRRIGVQGISQTLAGLRESLNLSQGLSRDVRFLNAPLAISILESFGDSLPKLELPKLGAGAFPAWVEGSKVVRLGMESLEEILLQEQQEYVALLEEISHGLGDINLVELQDLLAEVERGFLQSKLPSPVVPDFVSRAKSLERIKSALSKVPDPAKHPLDAAGFFSSTEEVKADGLELRADLASVVVEYSDHLNGIKQRIKDGRSDKDLERMIEVTTENLNLAAKLIKQIITDD